MTMTRLARIKWLAFGIAVGAVLGAGTVAAIAFGAERAEEQRMHSAIERVADDVTDLVNAGDRQFGIANQAADFRVSTVGIDAEGCGAITVSILGEEPTHQPVTATLHLEPDAVGSDGCPSSFVPTLTIGD